MEPLSSDEIRRRFLRFFEQRGHLILPSSPLVSYDDPSVLFTTAGMQQFKPYFTGEKTPPAPRIATVQKCFRTADLDDVGDASHLTFFEMLGNFSFGDYFKKEAIEFAWELATRELTVPPERIWVTVFGGAEDLGPDEEAAAYWRAIGVPEERIVRIPGWDDNWWGPTGDSGPCGPCSELQYDRGPEFGCGRADCTPAHSCGRFLEVWNLVFNQYFSAVPKDKLTMSALTPLPRTGIDTGAGLERWAALLQGTPSVYETDLFRPLVDKACALLNVTYGQDPQVTRAVRIIVEHTRAASFLIADGVVPSNEGRGYVLRRILRRAIRQGRLLGREEPFLAPIAEAVIARMGETYPELVQHRELITHTLTQEEQRFGQTLVTGMNLLEQLLDTLEARGEKVVPGEQVFQLYDTYGFPPDLTRDIAQSRGFTIDEEGLRRALERQQERSRAAAGFREREYLPEIGTRSIFVGYEPPLVRRSRVVGLLKGTQPVEWLSAGEEGSVILAETPFYAEAGGQVGDTGEIRGPQGTFAVFDTQSPEPGVILHIGRMLTGSLALHEEVEAAVDVERRLDTMRNHTATHLLHAALRQVLGSHVRQAGSLVHPERLRFDFTHGAALTPEQIEAIERLVNAQIRADLPVEKEWMDREAALASGAMALFGEKYGERVRVVTIPGFSKELCGGTHLTHTGEIGFFLITQETSIGAGVRRIEALTGRGAEEYERRERRLLQRLSAALAAPVDALEERVAQLQNDLQSLRRQLAQQQREALQREVEALAQRAEQVGPARVVAGRITVTDPALLREAGDLLRGRLGEQAAVLLAATANGRPTFLVMVTPALASRGVRANEIAREVGRVAGGGGGGSPETAQAGGRDPQLVDVALQRGLQLIRERLGAS
jgi:alanyl-tRNA synthetase